ncbi:hypothetical protein G210_3974, partial [Candida maltosa Xu316]
MKIFRKLITTLLIYYHLATALDITENRITTDIDKIDEGNPVVICSNSYWSIVDVAKVEFKEDITVESNAMLYVSSTSDISLDFGHPEYKKLLNNGIIAVNGLASSAYVKVHLVANPFVNNGGMYFASSGSNSDNWYLTSNGEMVNNDLMVFYQKQRSASLVDIRGMTNNGQIYFRNSNFLINGDRAGTGCFTAIDGGSFYIKYPEMNFASTLSWYLADSTASMVVNGDSNEDIDNITFKVYGFGNGNKIELSSTSEKLDDSTYIYDAEAGVLTITSPCGYICNFDIGTGYNTELFEDFILIEEGESPDQNKKVKCITYPGKVPARELPASCQIPYKDAPPFPMDDTFPMTTVFTSTWESTDNAGSTITESGLISRIGTSDNTISTFPNPPVYTSTWVDDDTVTRSGLISQSGIDVETISTFPLNP